MIHKPTMNNTASNDITENDIENIAQKYMQKHARLYALLEKTLSPLRMKHSVYVAMRSLELVLADDTDAIEYEHAWLAGIAHDFCREHSFEQILSLAKKSKFSIEAYEQDDPILLHGKAAVTLLQQEYPLEQYISHNALRTTSQKSAQNIYFAIAHHTLGWKMPNSLLLVLFIADATSKDRGIEKSFLDTLSVLDIPHQCRVFIDFLAKKYNNTHPITKAMYNYCASVP